MPHDNRRGFTIPPPPSVTPSELLLSRNQRVIHLLTKLCGRRLGRTRLTKALFLADYQARKHFGHPITTYDYKFHHYGPWTGQIREDVESLEAVSLVKEHTYLSFKGVGHYYTARGDAHYSNLGSSELFVLEAVCDHCASGDLDELLREIYDTPPMRIAKQLGRGARIPMEMFDAEEPGAEGVQLGNVERAEQELDLGLGEDFHAALNGLQAHHFADR